MRGRGHLPRPFEKDSLSGRGYTGLQIHVSGHFASTKAVLSGWVSLLSVRKLIASKPVLIVLVSVQVHRKSGRTNGRANGAFVRRLFLVGNLSEA